MKYQGFEEMKKSITLLLLIFSFQILNAQPGCPGVSITPNNLNICGGCTTLTAAVQGTVTTTSYSVDSIPYTPFAFNTGTPVLIGIDDEWSGVISLPFCFDFFGSTYTQCVVGSNGCIGFDLANANQYNTWPIADSIPTTTVPDMLNTIMGPWHDIDPGVGGSQYYELQGAAPCRRLVVSWFQVPMFSVTCNSLLATHQIVLYETTNIIEVYIQDKPICPTWNSGAAIEGIQDATGTQAYVVPGRNYPVQWTATNDAWRFTPAGAPQYTLTWYDGTTAIGTSDTVNVCPTTTTTYTAELVNNTCNGSDTVTAQATINVNPAFSLSVSSTPAACAASDGTATVNVTGGGNPPFSYSWSSTPAQTTSTATGLPAGNYTVTVTDTSGCIATASTVVPGNVGPSASIVSSANVLCNGGNTASATVSATGGTPPFNYAWSPIGGNTATANNLSAGNYLVVVSDSNGCSDTVTVTITEPPAITLATSFIQATCNQSNGSCTVNASGGTPAYNYAWSPTGGNAATANNISAGNYSVVVTDANGCTATASVTVTNTFSMTASFIATPPTTTMDAPLITFTDNSTNATSWLWNFGDGSPADTGVNPIHTYSAPGNYNVCLIASNLSGCSDTACNIVRIDEGLFVIYIPNAFTPNQDGTNDFFTASGLGITDFELIIYDRWGLDIYKTGNMQSGWNGILADGKAAPMGVYLYLILVKDPLGVDRQFAGKISLIR
jgi:gliding motility-associated-like protein